MANTIFKVFTTVGLGSLAALIPLEVSAAVLSPSKLYVFGDSLSDTGNVFNATVAANGIPALLGFDAPPVSPPPPYFEGRNSNGPVWVDQLADSFDLSLTNSTELSILFPGIEIDSPLTLTFDGPAVSPYFDGSLADNSVNFSFGGAQTGLRGSTEFGELIPGLLTQVGWFETDLGRADAVADSDALYIVWGGANDYWGADPNADPSSLATGAVGNLQTAVERLYATGARRFLLPNLPDLGQTPRGLISMSESQRLSGLTLSHNSLLETAVDSLSLLPGSQVLDLDVFSLFEQAIDQPQSFGLTNVTDSCLATPTCLNSSLVQETFLFWDDRHPTTAAHRELATAALALGDMTTPLVPPTPVPAVTPASVSSPAGMTVPEPATGLGLLGLLTLWGIVRRGH